MRKLILGLMVVAALSFVSYGALAHCGKCGHDGPKCASKSCKPACKSMADRTVCGKMKPCGCCDKCAKGEYSCMDGKPCCDKCTCKKSCSKMPCDKPCCDKCAKGECMAMSGGKPCCDKCACAASKPACKKGAAVQDFAPDPVCGMDVDTKDAKYTSEHEGKTYYFCNESCKERFDKDPSKFLGE